MKNYQKWSTLIIDHLRRDHMEVFPYLSSKILPPNPTWKHLSTLLHFLYKSMSKESFSPLSMESFPHDVWMALWEAYGDPQDPPFPKEILPPITLVMVPLTPMRSHLLMLLLLLLI